MKRYLIDKPISQREIRLILVRRIYYQMQWELKEHWQESNYNRRKIRIRLSHLFTWTFASIFFKYNRHLSRIVAFICRVWCHNRVAATIAFCESVSNCSSAVLDDKDVAICWANKYCLEMDSFSCKMRRKNKRSTELLRRNYFLLKTSNIVDVFQLKF